VSRLNVSEGYPTEKTGTPSWNHDAKKPALGKIKRNAKNRGYLRILRILRNKFRHWSSSQLIADWNPGVI